MLIRAAIIAAVALTQAAAAAADTQWHYDRRGAPAGKTVRFGDTDRRYDARGNVVRKSTTFGDRTHHYDARGNLIGKSSPQLPERR